MHAHIVTLIIIIMTHLASKICIFVDMYGFNQNTTAISGNDGGMKHWSK